LIWRLSTVCILFEFVLRDFMNIERCCTYSSTILVHDSYPIDERTAHRSQVTSFWSGDVWKLILCLKRYRPDLNICTVATPPTGLTIIRGLNPSSEVLKCKMVEICEEFISLPFSALEGNKRDQLNIVENDWDVVCLLL
jgi:hypothetical protein